MTSIVTKSLELDCMSIKLPEVEAFFNRYGKAHLLFACHAALPLGLTPELLYSLWANFQVDCHGENLEIPWIATSDLLLSNFCEEVGNGLYEMEASVRQALLSLLEQNRHFGLKRIREVAAFLSIHVQSQLKSENLDIRDFSQAQKWLSMAYLQPESAAKELVTTLANAFQRKSDDLLRIASIVEALEKPLADYPDLLNYAQGMTKYAQGDIEAAQKEFDKIRKSENLYNFSSEGIPIPRGVKQQVELEQKQKRKRLSPASQIFSSLLFGTLTSGAFWILQNAKPTESVVDDLVPASKYESPFDEEALIKVPPLQEEQQVNQGKYTLEASLPSTEPDQSEVFVDESKPVSDIQNTQETLNQPPVSAEILPNQLPSAFNTPNVPEILNQESSSQSEGFAESPSNQERESVNSPPLSSSSEPIFPQSPTQIEDSATSETAATDSEESLIIRSSTEETAISESGVNISDLTVSPLDGLINEANQIEGENNDILLSEEGLPAEAGSEELITSEANRATTGGLARLYSVEGEPVYLKRRGWSDFYTISPPVFLYGDDLLRISPGTTVILMCPDRNLSSILPSGISGADATCPGTPRSLR